MSDLWQPPHCVAQRGELEPGACVDGEKSRCLNECRLDPAGPGPAPADLRGDPHTSHRYPVNPPLAPVFVDATQGVVIFDFADRPTTVIDGECRECDDAGLDDDPQPDPVPWTGTWPEEWVQLGATVEGGSAELPSRSGLGPGELYQQAVEGGSLTTTGNLDDAPRNRTASITFTLPEINAENVMAALTGDALWTIGDALQFLDPAPPRRTVSRWLKGLPAIGWRRLPQGGPSARTYRASDVMARHARWAKSHTPPPPA